MNSERLSLRVSPELARRVRQGAALRGISQAEYIERLLDLRVAIDCIVAMPGPADGALRADLRTELASLGLATVEIRG